MKFRSPREVWDDYLIGKLSDMVETGQITVSCSLQHLEEIEIPPDIKQNFFHGDESSELQFLAENLSKVANTLTQNTSLEQESIGEILLALTEAKAQVLYSEQLREIEKG